MILPCAAVDELELEAIVVLGGTAMAESGRGGGASREHRANPRSVGIVGGIVAAINLVSRAPAPTSVYIARVTEAHQSWFGWAPPIRARVRGPFDPLGSNGREINLTK